MFHALVEYKNQRGHCNVPAKWRANPRLGRWVDKQRQEQRQNIIEQARLVRLNSIGFVWTVLTDNWERMFQALLRYRQEHGDSNVPTEWSCDRKLARWVNKQRANRKHKRLSVERVHQLDEISFVWKSRDTKWAEMYSALVQYKTLHGRCNVPAEYEENPQLGRWVKKQRQRRKSRTLDDERIRRLTEIGFFVTMQAWSKLQEARPAFNS